jgi:hypothetical protein
MECDHIKELAQDLQKEKIKKIVEAAEKVMQKTEKNEDYWQGEVQEKPSEIEK